jgi:hypothetical protein
MVLVGLVFNETWEKAQMLAYVETAGDSRTSTLALCTRAAVGDVGIILGISAAGALAIHDEHARGACACACAFACCGSVAACANDPAATADFLDCPALGGSQYNERHLSMSHTDG